jgi:hypothetical protein
MCVSFRGIYWGGKETTYVSLLQQDFSFVIIIEQLHTPLPIFLFVDIFLKHLITSSKRMQAFLWWETCSWFDDIVNVGSIMVTVNLSKSKT